jgi:prepilin-type N-terminal cleavage/methylation domain-containing protein
VKEKEHSVGKKRANVVWVRIEDVMHGRHLILRAVNRRRVCAGFTLIELLLVIAIIGIMSTLVITTVTNAAADARRTMCFQQQVTLQDALNSWIAEQSSGTNSLAAARSNYSAASTAAAWLGLLGSNYLHPSTYQHFLSNSTGTQIRSEAMIKSGMSLRFTTWNGTNYPTVEWN